jgi:hypothetical protein
VLCAVCCVLFAVLCTVCCAVSDCVHMCVLCVVRCVVSDCVHMCVLCAVRSVVFCVRMCVLGAVFVCCAVLCSGCRASHRAQSAMKKGRKDIGAGSQQ